MRVDNSWMFEPDPTEMIAIVEIYIHIRKNVNVRISTENINIVKLKQAYMIATKYFQEANVKINRI